MDYARLHGGVRGHELLFHCESEERHPHGLIIDFSLLCVR